MELKHINREISQLATMEATNYISEHGLEKLKEYRYLRSLHMKQEVKKLTIPDVSQQRELLIDCVRECLKDKESITVEQQIDTYLRNKGN